MFKFLEEADLLVKIIVFVVIAVPYMYVSLKFINKYGFDKKVQFFVLDTDTGKEELMATLDITGMTEEEAATAISLVEAELQI